MPGCWTIRLRGRFASDGDFFIAQKCEVLLRNLDKRGSWSQRRRVLDAGCGQGVAVDLLRNRCSVVGSDVSFPMLATAARKGRVVQQEPFDLPFATGAFDAAFAFCVYHHIEPGDRCVTSPSLRGSSVQEDRYSSSNTTR
jgi:SAM-dependent methyltransferase